MVRRSRIEHLVALDIGTTKICVLVAEQKYDGSIEITGIGTHPSHGLKKGVVVDIDTTVGSIKHALTQAEAMANIKIKAVTVGISGGHIQSFNSHGVVAVKSRDVEQGDIDRVVDAARAVPIPSDREVLHVLPTYFKIDGEEVGDRSLGMHGTRLEAGVHIITGNIASASNIIKCCELAGIEVSDIVLEPIASAEAVLTESERALGVGMIDIGGGTSDFVIYKNGKIRYSKVLPFAGNHFTNDIAICFRIPLSKAEDIKKRYGHLDYEGVSFSGAPIKVALDYEGKIREVSPRELGEVLTFRAHEIFDLLVRECLDAQLIPLMRYGLVVTGGGSLLDGIDILAAETFMLPTRRGVPLDRAEQENNFIIPDSLKNPIYATASGIVMYMVRKDQIQLVQSTEGPLFSKVFKRMKSWIYDFL